VGRRPTYLRPFTSATIYFSTSRARQVPINRRIIRPTILDLMHSSRCHVHDMCPWMGTQKHEPLLHNVTCSYDQVHPIMNRRRYRPVPSSSPSPSSSSSSLLPDMSSVPQELRSRASSPSHSTNSKTPKRPPAWQQPCDALKLSCGPCLHLPLMRRV
jgi:hypothetical protein